MEKQKGQILLIVILVVIVSSTIGLSLASRTITSLKSSTEEAESQKALAAAEAGIERATQGSEPAMGAQISENVWIGAGGENPSNNSAYSTTIEKITGSQILLNGGTTISKDEGADLWLSDPASNFASSWVGNSLIVYWGESSVACNNPALEIIVVSGSKNNPVSRKYAYDPCSTRQGENHFSSPSGSGAIRGKTFYHSANIGIASGLIARIIPIYGNTSIGIDGRASVLPLQGYKVESTGTSGDASRKLTVFSGYPQTYLPYLSYGLFVAN